MKTLDQKLIDICASLMKGKRLEHFLRCTAIINESLADGQWISRGKVKAQKGFSQGLITNTGFSKKSFPYKENRTNEELLNDYADKVSYKIENAYEHKIYDDDKVFSIDKAVDYIRKVAGKKFKLTNEEVKAWFKLLDQKKKAQLFLDEARPKPIFTEINLSRRVTTTLTEMNLDIDISTIRYPELKRFSYMKPMFNRNGEFVKEVKAYYYVPVWPKGIIHDQSRFATSLTNKGCNCDACGRFIPSAQFVPLMAKDKNLGKMISLWVGRDCAGDIFGVKDIGITRDKPEGA